MTLTFRKLYRSHFAHLTSTSQCSNNMLLDLFDSWGDTTLEHLDKKKKITIMIAIMSAMLFAALNQTIVGTALPRIIADLGGMEYFSWVFTVYMLAATVTAVLAGKLSDIYGRKPFILSGIIIFIIGSFLAGLSNTIIELIVYRGV